MLFGGNTDNVKNRRRVIRARLAEGQCTYCPPHRGENYGLHGRKDRRHVSAGNFVRRKRKETK